MKTIINHIHLVAALLLSASITARCQTGFFVPADGKIFFMGDSATVFSNVLNLGKLGIGKNATINFYGAKWENDRLSLITDESNDGTAATGVGGIVRFLSSDTLPQKISGGYNAATGTGPAFYHVKVENKYGIQLEGSSTKIRNELQFIEGLVYVKDNILSIGTGKPGIISGYDSLHYIVTDMGESAGYLLREGITARNGMVVFPVGSNKNSYTPAGILIKDGEADNYYVNVNDGVKRGVLHVELTKPGVKKTWEIGKQLRPGQDNVEITLQHLTADEGSVFSNNRGNAYIAQFIDTAWSKSSHRALPVAGALTTGPVLNGSGMNSNTFFGSVSSDSYFTKLTGKGDTSKTLLWFNGYRLDADYARVYWRTNPEMYNKYFVLQRRLSREADFRNIDTIATMSINGASFRNLNYEIKDLNNYDGISFYRLIMVNDYNEFSYSNVIAVAPMNGKYKLLLWPNPARGRFFVGLNKEVDIRALIIWNSIGKEIRQENVDGRSIIEFHGLIPGTYYVSFISTTGKTVETKKVIVMDY